MNYRIVKKDAFRIVGVREEISMDFEQSFKTVPVFWDKTFQSGIVPKILGLMNGEPMGLLGACAFEDDGKKCFYYISVATDKPAEDGMVECVIPASTWAVFADSGAPKSIQQLQQRIFTEWLPSSGYEWSNQPDMEVYLNDDTVNMQYEVWLPVVKKV